MTKTTEALAREAGMHFINAHPGELEDLARFESLARADERERIVAALNEMHCHQTINNQEYTHQWHAGIDEAIDTIRSVGD